MVSRAKEKLHKIFTYGTLKTGQSNHHELTDPEHGRCKLLGTGRTQQTFPLVLPSNYDYPYLLNKERLGHVSVLIVIMKWKVSEKTLVIRISFSVRLRILKSENRCRHCSLFRVSFTVSSLKTSATRLCDMLLACSNSVQVAIFPLLSSTHFSLQHLLSHVTAGKKQISSEEVVW